MQLLLFNKLTIIKPIEERGVGVPGMGYQLRYDVNVFISTH